MVIHVVRNYLSPVVRIDAIFNRNYDKIHSDVVRFRSTATKYRLTIVNIKLKKTQLLPTTFLNLTMLYICRHLCSQM